MRVYVSVDVFVRMHVRVYDIYSIVLTCVDKRTSKAHTGCFTVKLLLKTLQNSIKTGL